LGVFTGGIFVGAVVFRLNHAGINDAGLSVPDEEALTVTSLSGG